MLSLRDLRSDFRSVLEDGYDQNSRSATLEQLTVVITAYLNSVEDAAGNALMMPILPSQVNGFVSRFFDFARVSSNGADVEMMLLRTSGAINASLLNILVGLSFMPITPVTPGFTNANTITVSSPPLGVERIASLYDFSEDQSLLHFINRFTRVLHESVSSTQVLHTEVSPAGVVSTFTLPVR